MTLDDGRLLERNGRDAHRAGDYRRALEAYEQAFAAYRRSDDILASARAARTVAWFNGWVYGDWAVHRGWISRARRLLEDADHDPARGWILLDDALNGNDYEIQRRQYLQAIDVARACGDHDLECDAIASLGMMLVFSGHPEDGMAHLDEALAAICGGDVTEIPVVEGCLCGLLSACERTHDLGRADQWLRAAQSVMRSQNLVSVAGYCRAHYAGILLAAGRWDDAEDELMAVLDQLSDDVGVRATARCRLAGLRVQQGRLEDADVLLAGLDDHPDHALPRARLLSAKGRPQPAIEILERVTTGDLADFELAPLLAALVEAHLSTGGIDAAVDASDRLGAISALQSSAFVAGIAAAAQARVCTVLGEPGKARTRWRQAIGLFQQSGRAVDIAVARLELARLLVDDDRPDAAIAELESAHATFVAAGARRAADEAAALMRSLGGSPKTGPKLESTLTRREEEVLELLPHGLTNAEIAERLFISPKTVEHHVSRILTKLGIRSRVEAAAYALRR